MSPVSPSLTIGTFACRQCPPMTISVDEFLADIPLLHTWDKGRTWSTGGFRRRHLEPLRRLIEKRRVRRIIETGCGASTILFLLLDTDFVLSIDPSEDLYRRLQAWCDENGVSRAKHEMHLARSELVLPAMAGDAAGSFDLALIDGDHAWPGVFVDFCYCNMLLPRGGFLVLDDVQLHSVAELARLLAEEPGFALRLDLGKALVFEKLDRRKYPIGWMAQPYILRRSRRRALVHRRRM